MIQQAKNIIVKYINSHLSQELNKNTKKQQGINSQQLCVMEDSRNMKFNVSKTTYISYNAKFVLESYELNSHPVN